MNLLNRYLQAVKFWLPRGQQDDITAELREDLQSRIDEREAGLGRRLTEAEIAAVLKETGRPVFVASRYRPQQSLIGPVLYPIYLFVLKIIGLCYLGPWLLVFFSLMAFDQSYRAAQPWGQALLGAWATLWSIGFAIFGIITVAFAVLERAQARSKWLEQWEPMKLPAVRDSRQIKRSNAIAEIIANLVIAAWWVNGWWSHLVLPPSVRITVAPVWHFFFWAVLGGTVANVSMAVVNLYRPYWTRSRAAIRLVLDTAGSALFCWLLKPSVLTGIVAPGISSAQAAALVSTINAGLERAFPFTVAACVVVVAIADLPRLFSFRSHVSKSHATPVRA